MSLAKTRRDIPEELVREPRPPGKRQLSAETCTRNLARMNAFRARRINRLPAWADLKAIERVYVEARRRNLREQKKAAMLSYSAVDAWTVDHIYPLDGWLVSGLHVLENLRLARWSANGPKGRNGMDASTTY